MPDGARDFSRLPGWPRWLSRELAAAYVGVSATLFDQEVAAGKWPAGERRGAKGGRVTWDRQALDLRSDRQSGLSSPEAALPDGNDWDQEDARS